MPRRFPAKVVEKRDYGCASELIFRVPDSFRPRPGQFVHILCGGEGRILRRPYSVFRRSEKTASVLVREAGGGSAWLRGRKLGETLDILGPLGRGFDVEGDGKSYLVAGGTGIAPLVFLHASLRERGVETVLLWGMESADEYGSLPGELAEEADLYLATLDGSLGIRGTVVDLVMKGEATVGCRIYACGPRPMLVALVERLPPKGIAGLQVSVEERMACGLGVCRGCVVPAARPLGGYLTVCRDGPVFRGEELDWEGLRKSI